MRQIRCDQGEELANSRLFRDVVQKHGYSIEPTGSDNSSQNGIAERPNRTYGDMMRTMLMNAGLDSRYWSYALVQAVFIKNRLPHSHHLFQKTPYEALTGRRPNLKDLKVFGSRIIAKNTGKRTAKLDDHTSSGIFLHHTASTAIYKYVDDKTGREKATSHVDFDEAHYTSTTKPLGAQMLIDVGYNSKYNTITSSDIDFTAQQDLLVKLLSDNAVMPQKATDGSAGLDICSAYDVTIPPGHIKLVKTDLAITCPPGTYGRLAPRSGLTVKRSIDIRAGVIDSDYTGNIQVALYNLGTEEQYLPKHTKVAQLIIERIASVNIKQTTELASSTRGDNGFGSTGEQHNPPPPSPMTSSVSHDNPQQSEELPTPKPSSTPSAIPIPYTSGEIQ